MTTKEVRRHVLWVKEAPPIEVMKERLTYNPETGLFHWRDKRWSRRGLDNPAGSTTRWGYRTICINYVHHAAHRLAWLYVYGEWPEFDIDHIDGNRDNNAIANLRLATRRENSQNTRISKNNTSGFIGVSYHKQSGKWRAYIGLDYKYVHLGLHDTPEAAYQAHLEAKAKLHTFNPVPRDLD